MKNIIINNVQTIIPMLNYFIDSINMKNQKFNKFIIESLKTVGLHTIAGRKYFGKHIEDDDKTNKFILNHLDLITNAEIDVIKYIKKYNNEFTIKDELLFLYNRTFNNKELRIFKKQLKEKEEEFKNQYEERLYGNVQGQEYEFDEFLKYSFENIYLINSLYNENQLRDIKKIVEGIIELATKTRKSKIKPKVLEMSKLERTDYKDKVNFLSGFYKYVEIEKKDLEYLVTLPINPYSFIDSVNMSNRTYNQYVVEQIEKDKTLFTNVDKTYKQNFDINELADYLTRQYKIKVNLGLYEKPPAPNTHPMDTEKHNIFLSFVKKMTRSEFDIMTEITKHNPQYLFITDEYKFFLNKKFSKNDLSFFEEQFHKIKEEFFTKDERLIDYDDTWIKLWSFIAIAMQNINLMESLYSVSNKKELVKELCDTIIEMQKIEPKHVVKNQMNLMFHTDEFIKLPQELKELILKTTIKLEKNPQYGKGVYIRFLNNGLIDILEKDPSLIPIYKNIDEDMLKDENYRRTYQKLMINVDLIENEIFPNRAREEAKKVKEKQQELVNNQAITEVTLPDLKF